MNGETAQRIITITIELPTSAYHSLEKSAYWFYIGMKLKTENLKFALAKSTIIPVLKNYVTKLLIRMIESRLEEDLYPISSIYFWFTISRSMLTTLRIIEHMIDIIA